MLVAKTETNDRVVATEAQKGAQFFCPYCGNPVILKKGRIVTHHFAHATQPFGCDHRNETEIHESTKLSIFNWLRSQDIEADIEHPLNGCRPDVWFRKDGSQIAVEVQHTQIPADEIVRRTKVINRNGCHVLWIIPNVVKVGYEIRTPAMWRFLKGWYFGSLFMWDGERSRVDRLTLDTATRYSDWMGAIRYLKSTATPRLLQSLDLVADFAPANRRYDPRFAQYPPAQLYTQTRKSREGNQK